MTVSNRAEGTFPPLIGVGSEQVVVIASLEVEVTLSDDPLSVLTVVGTKALPAKEELLI